MSGDVYGTTTGEGFSHTDLFFILEGPRGVLIGTADDERACRVKTDCRFSCPYRVFTLPVRGTYTVHIANFSGAINDSEVPERESPPKECIGDGPYDLIVNRIKKTRAAKYP